jgi:hypothetical protein
VTSTKIFEGFSLSHAAILDGTTGAESASLYGCRNGTVTPDQGNFENTGDDIVLSEWFWINFANVTVEEGFIPYDTVATITGTTVSSSGAAPNDYYSIPLWTLASMNTVTRPMAVRSPAKDSAGSIYTLDFVLYKVQFMPFSFTGPSYKNGLTFSVSGRALLTSKDEVGNALPLSYGGPFSTGGLSIGRLIASPGFLSGAFTARPFAGT